MDVHEAHGAPRRRRGMTTLQARYLTELRAHADAWQDGEIDFATFMQLRDTTWQHIREYGEAMEAAVLRTLRDQLPTGKPGEPTHVRVVGRILKIVIEAAATDHQQENHCHA